MLNEQRKIGLSPLPRRSAAAVDLHSRRHTPLRTGSPEHRPGSKPAMKRSLLISAALHLVAIAVMIFGLPNFLPPLPPPLIIVPVEITDIGEITNTRIKPDKEPEPKPAPPPKQTQKQAPVPKPQEDKPQEQKPAPPVEDKQAEALPDKKKPPPKKPPPKKAQEKPKPKPKTNMLASVLNNVAKLKPQTTAKDTDKDAKDDSAEPDNQAPSLSDRLTISEEDALRRQIGLCWNMPVGARNAEQLIVEVEIEVNPDRTVRSAQIVDQARMADPFFRAAAESAVRALRHPNCTPLALPEGKHEQWKVIHFNFDPRDML